MMNLQPIALLSPALARNVGGSGSARPGLRARPTSAEARAMAFSRRTALDTRGRTKQSVAASAAMLATYMAGPLFTSPALAAWFPDLEVVSQSSAKNSNSSRSVTVTCPVGKAVINAGADIDNGRGSVTIEKMIPDAAYTSVTVTAFETDPTGNNWAITALASCATAPVGLVWIFVQSPVNSLDKSATAICPAGTTLLGVGAQVKNGLGNVIIDEIAPDGLPGVAGTMSTVIANEDAVYGGQWSVTAAVSCAAPIPGQQAIRLPSTYDAKNNKDIQTSCPAGQVLTGGAAEVGTFLPGEVVIVGTFPDSYSPGSPPTSFKASGAEEDSITLPGRWDIAAKAICADQ